MSERSTEIAIIGGGPAGAHLASRLAAAGRECVVFDPRGAWEKPCGGGVPSRALREFSFILEDTRYPRKLINRLTIISPLDRRVTVNFETPFAIYSRKALNSLVLDRAIEAGARFVQSGVTDFRREPDGWTLTTQDEREWRARFLVGADGAASPTRRKLVGIFPIQDLAIAVGYNISSEHPSEKFDSMNHPDIVCSTRDPMDTVLVRYPRNIAGYFWAFPRPGSMNFGLACKMGECTTKELKGQLQEYIQDYYDGNSPETEKWDFFAGKIPNLSMSSWPNFSAAGNDWALVGDAAGFVDPITGEGIYYALKSSELLCDSFMEVSLGQGKTRRNYKQITDHYQQLCYQHIRKELERASYLFSKFYHEKFMGQIFSDAMIRFAKYHRGVRSVMAKAILGDQSYLSLKRDLIRSVIRLV